MINKKEFEKLVENIREKIGHEKEKIKIKEIIFDKLNNELIIIVPDRYDKSLVIGKGGWVVGKLRETLNVKHVHVETYSDLLVKKYRMKLSLEKLNKLIKSLRLESLKIIRNLLKNRITELPLFNIPNFETNEKVLVALSGGVDSSFSLVVMKYLGFDVEAVTVDPGPMILPKIFKKNIEKLCSTLEVKHKYIKTDFSNFIEECLKGRFHPCGRCSKKIYEKIKKYCKKKGIKILVFGDLLSTGYGAISLEDGIVKISLPALLCMSKHEIKQQVSNFDLELPARFGCPLLHEVHKRFPRLRFYSIQRILRENRAGALEPGESLKLIWRLCKNFDDSIYY